MLRITNDGATITFELWGATRGAKHTHTYPATDANKAHLQAMIATRQNRQQRPRPDDWRKRNPALFTYPGRIDHIMPDRDQQHHNEIWLVRPTRHYRIVGGVYYPENTPARVIEVLENARAQRLLRLRIFYGDTTTGRCWSDGQYEGDGGIASGYVGNTTGWLKSPLLCHNRRSTGGGIISSDRIVKIEFSNKHDGGILYQHPHFHLNTAEGVE